MTQPILLNCSCYLGEHVRCPSPATLWLIQDDGKPNPGGYVCRAHGEAIVAEFGAKLGECWTLIPI